jgi:hypothetical protein
MKFTQIPENTFKELQMNAGILVDTFEPKTGTIGNLLGATTGGCKFSATPTFQDLGDDIDNCPKNVKELKKLESIEAKMSGTYLTVTADSAKSLAGAADIDTDDPTHVVPRADLTDDDFEDIWWIGDYSNLNGEKNGGFCAIHLMSALSTGGFSIQTTDKGKGQFAFEYTAHYTMKDQSKIPYEIYVKAGEDEDAEPAEETSDSGQKETSESEQGKEVTDSEEKNTEDVNEA